MKKLMIVSAALVAVTAQAGWGDLGKAAAKDAAAATISGISRSMSARNSANDAEKVEQAKKEEFAKKQAQCDDAEAAKKKGMRSTYVNADRIAAIQDDGEFFEQYKSKYGNAKGVQCDTLNKRAGRMKASNLIAEFYRLQPGEVARIENDALFYEIFKANVGNASPENKAKLLERACGIADENLLVEFLRSYPDQIASITEKERFFKLKLENAKLGELIIDNVKGVKPEAEYNWNIGLNTIVYYSAKCMDEATRSKYIKIADDNLAKAKQDEDTLVVDKYYVGMPVLDWVMRSFEGKQSWTKIEKPVSEGVNICADLKQSVGENWKQEWKTKALLFKSKDRQKLFKVKGTVDGLHEFVKKHVNKDAERKDITIDGGWWMYLDDLHELKIMLKDKTGELQIVKQ